jgi:hypothetical protein
MYGNRNGNRGALRSVNGGKKSKLTVAAILRDSYRRYMRDQETALAVKAVLGPGAANQGA